MTITTDRPTNGHKTDLEELYREQRDRLVGVGIKAGPHRDAAEDAVQQVFVDALEHPEKIADARNLGALVATRTKYRAMDESVYRGRQTPTDAEIMQRQADLGSQLGEEDGDAFAACMGDPQVAALVSSAIDALPERERIAVRGFYLDGRSVSDLSVEFEISKSTVYVILTKGVERLKAAGLKLPQTETAPPAKKLTAVERAAEQLRADYGDTPPADLPGMTVLAKHYGWDNKKTSAARALYTGAPQWTSKGTPKTKRSPRKAMPTVEQLAAALTKAAGTTRLGVDSAEKILRSAFGQCSRDRAIAAKDLHNDRAGHPRAERSTAPAAKVAAVVRVPAAPTVAEAWLTRADDQVTAMFVNTDESTTKHPAVFRSMSGAQREITGHLVGQGYRPDGAWTDHDADESSRRFTPADTSGDNR